MAIYKDDVIITASAKQNDVFNISSQLYHCEPERDAWQSPFVSKMATEVAKKHVAIHAIHVIRFTVDSV